MRGRQGLQMRQKVAATFRTCLEQMKGDKWLRLGKLKRKTTHQNALKTKYMLSIIGQLNYGGKCMESEDWDQLTAADRGQLCRPSELDADDQRRTLGRATEFLLCTLSTSILNRDMNFMLGEQGCQPATAAAEGICCR